MIIATLAFTTIIVLIALFFYRKKNKPVEIWSAKSSEVAETPVVISCPACGKENDLPTEKFCSECIETHGMDESMGLSDVTEPSDQRYEGPTAIA